MKKVSTVISFLMLLVLGAFAQRGERMRGNLPEIPRDKSVIMGVVLDENTNHPIEYANIVIYRIKDSTQVTGTVSNNRGFFYIAGLKPGKYYVTVDFIGYKSITISDVTIKKLDEKVRLGRIYLKPVVLQGEETEVVAERPEISYQIDKKVIDVSKQLTSLSGTAVDVLENIPSVTVDVEGNVSLRGSSNFQVLINGIPSILEPNEILQQIAASSIERIEVITNPSVKYDPDGTTGIINIILKKGHEKGMNGMLNFNGGLDEKYGGDFLINFQKNKWNFYVGANFNHGKYPGDMETRNESMIQGITTHINSQGSSYRQREFYYIRSGFSYKLSPADIFDGALRIGGMNFERGSNLNYTRFSSFSPIVENYFNESSSKRSGSFFSGNLNYKHKFLQEGHEFTLRVNYRGRDGDDKTINSLRDSLQQITDGQQTFEEGPNKRLRFQMDYSYPYSMNGKLELGANGRLGRYDDNTRFEFYNPTQGGFVEDTTFAKSVHYKRNILALYGQISNNVKGVQFQLGLRGEYTYRDITLSKTNESFKIDRWDYFPSLHISSKFMTGLQAMASYTRRINRPRGWFLEPFETWDDAYNVRKGNPDLKPEYIDSYEAGIQFPWKRNFVSLEAYYRITNNKIERIQQVYSPEVTLHTFDNIGKDYALGIEFMSNVDLFPWWNVRLMGNLYDYRIKGVLFNESFDENSFNWDLRFNNSLSLGKRSQIQLNLIYNSPTVSSQGHREGFASVNLGVKYDLIPRTFIATLQVRDLFATSKYEFSTTGPDFNRYNYFSMDAPIVMINFRYFINNYKPKRMREEQDVNGMEEGEDF